MDCQTAALSGKFRDDQIQNKNMVGAVAQKFSLFSLFIEIYDIHCMENFIEECRSLLQRT